MLRGTQPCITSFQPSLPIPPGSLYEGTALQGVEVSARISAVYPLHFIQIYSHFFSEDFLVGVCVCLTTEYFYPGNESL